MTEPTGGDDQSVNVHDVRAVGVSLAPDELREGDTVNRVVEARRMDQPTGTLLPVKNVVYHGLEFGRLRFDTEIGKRLHFSPFEIYRVELADV